MTNKISKLFFITIGLVFLCTMIFSCNNLIEIKQNISSQKAYISISANLPGSNARTVLPTAVNEDTKGLTWELKGKSGSDKTFEKTWSDTEDKTAYANMLSDANILLDVGNWSFTLTVYNNEGKILEATIGDNNNPIKITKDGPIELKFVMQEASGEDAANGQIEFTLKFPSDVVSQVEATLYKYSDLSGVGNSNFLQIQASDGTSYSYVVYKNSNDLPPGYYKLNLELEQKTGLTPEDKNPIYETITTYSCLIRVAPGLLSSGSYTLESLAKLYPVTFELKGGTLNGETTLTYNKYQTFTLPTPVREGFEFAGWYKEEDFSSEKIEGNYRLPDDVTNDGVTLYAMWERKLSLNYTFAIGDQDSNPDVVTDDKATYSKVDNKYGILNISNPNDSSSVWDYYVRTNTGNEPKLFKSSKNYSVSVDLKSEGGDTVVGIQAAYADMFFTVGTDWTTCTFETGFLDKDLPDGKNGITIGSALASTVYISNLVITEIEDYDNLPTLAFNVTKTGIENYLNNQNRSENIIEVAKTSSNEGYYITINTPLASNIYDETNTYLYNDVTLELRDYAKDKGINKVSFYFETSNEVYTSIVADTISPNSMAWNNKRQKDQRLSTIFPVFEEGEEVTVSVIKLSEKNIMSQDTTSFSIKNFEIKKETSYSDSSKFFAIKTPNTTTGGDKFTEEQNVPVTETITIPGNNTAKEFDVLMYNKNGSEIDWDEVTRFIYSNEEKKIDSLRYYISNDGKYYIQNTGSSEITCKITLTEDFTVQIEEVTTTGGNNQSGGATRESPSDQTNGLAYFTKSDGNSGNISCLYIYNEKGLGIYRDLVNGTLENDVTLTKGSSSWSLKTSCQGRVDACLADDVTVYDWVSIGTSNKPFTGSFDGQGHTITINNIDETYTGDSVGLFGNISYATISNLAIEGTISSTSATNVGGITGYSVGSTIENCVNFAEITGTENIGGIVGYYYQAGTVSKCINFGNIVASSSDDGYQSGIIGSLNAENNMNAIVTDCINFGEINSNSVVSGIVFDSYQWIQSSGPSVSVSNCINVGSMQGTSVYAIANAGVGNGCYYDTGTISGSVLESSGTGKTSSEICKLTENDLSSYWSFDTNRYPLPDLSNVFTDESNEIWNEIVRLAIPKSN